MMNLTNVIATRPNKTVYRDGDLALKVFCEGYSKADILNEALNHARVEETGLRIPQIVEVTKIDGKWSIIMQYIEGKTLAQIMAENPDNMKDYLDQMLDIQMEIHRQKAPLLTKLRDKMQRKISQTKLDATTRYDLHTRLDAMPKHDVVCHGDFNPSNVIITAEGESYSLDWAHATQGNASADVARTYLIFRLAGKDLEAEMYLNLFCKKSDTAKQYVQKWMPIVAATQMLKEMPAEQEFLKRWVYVVDYK